MSVVLSCLIPGNCLAQTLADANEDTASPLVFASDIANGLISEPQTLETKLADEAVASTPARSASFQPAPPALPRQEVLPIVELPRTVAATNLFGSFGIAPSFDARRRSLTASPSASVTSGAQARARAATDTGNLLGKSPSALGVEVQRRTPIVNDPRTRGSRVGSLAASGSYWVPARADLDTMVSKLDSRIIEDVIVVPGPYTVRHGPGIHHVDVELLSSPRYEDATEWHGSTSLEYKTNGEQWYGRQAVWGGSTTWGMRAGYGHRTGVDYESGAGIDIPSGYKSRDFDLALGYDVAEDEQIEITALRLDQSDVEFSGQLFDIDFLTTDGYEIEYTSQAGGWFDFDHAAVEVWYNRTRFAGNAQNPAKRQQFPFLNFQNYVGFTDVDSMSTGYRAFGTWGIEDEPKLTIGADLRYIKQELNEIASGRIGFNIFQDANSPIPRSAMPNPGLFADIETPVGDDLTVTLGARADYAEAEMLADPAEIASLGNNSPVFQSSLAEILGTGEFDQSFTLLSVFVTGRYELDEVWELRGGGGYAERPPSLTELYAAQPFLFLLQNGQNNVTGDPRLDPERACQLDLGLSCDTGRLRAGANVFHAWILDYITFENTGAFVAPPNGDIEQVNLKYVNTELATLTGFELYGEYDWLDQMIPFARLQFVEGRDQSRNGEFATQPAQFGGASTRVAGLPRGAFSGIPGGEEEPLPSMPPLESRLGLRFHEARENPLWAIEFLARIVDDQDRIAASLLESETSGFATFDLRGYWHANENLLLIAGVENLGNRDYREHLDFRTLTGLSTFQSGINLYASAQLTY